MSLIKKTVNSNSNIDVNQVSLQRVMLMIVLFTASDSLLIKEMFQSKITRTGTLAPSQRQQRSRKVSHKKKKDAGVKSAFSFFRKQKKPEAKVRTSIQAYLPVLVLPFH